MNFFVIIAILFTNLAWAKLPYARNFSSAHAYHYSTEETPLFEKQQYYLYPAPLGVGAMEAWKKPGGTGEHVKIMDIEVCYESNHEDLPLAFVPSVNPTERCASTDHGTAVLGILVGKKDDKGISGIAYNSPFAFYGFLRGEEELTGKEYINDINAGIQSAIDNLSPGDVMIIEQEMSGPEADAYIAVEYWPEIFAKLKEATDKGIICVEAAGNGYSNLDSSAYEGAFDLSKRDSGCVMVGASTEDHTRSFFSNYGTRVDVHAYGGMVTSLGYGDLFYGAQTRSYTNNFSGTSSATPIVAGAVAILSSMAKAKGRTVTPQEMRKALRETGTPQIFLDKVEDRIGPMPDVKAAAKYLDLE